MLDPLDALRLLLDWGADEAVGDHPVDRLAPAAAPAPAPARLPAAESGGPQAATIPALLEELRALPGIALRETATQFVPPAGDPAAPFLLLAEAPPSDDDRTGRAFSGQAGEQLDRVFASIGLNREQLLLAYLAPWRPPGGRKLHDSEVASCLPFARRLLALARPRLLILLGATAARALTGESNLRRLRGRLIQVELNSEQIVLPALVLPNLDQWLNTPASKQRLWSDLIFLQRALAKA